jgi:predicted Fe-Mo cluster-binding NifX family protein
MKLAFAADDGRTVSTHFGDARHYSVVTIEQGKIVRRDMRDKLGHNHFAGEEHAHEPGHPHSFDPAKQGRHMQMVESIRDCEAMLYRDMGMGAYESLRYLNIHPNLTKIADVDKAVAAHINGNLTDHAKRLH